MTQIEPFTDRAKWHKPELIDLSLLQTTGTKDAIASAEGTGGYNNKFDVSPS